MARESLADRIKTGPLTPQWKQLVSKNKDIASLKGNVDGPLGDYDKDLNSAADADADMRKAWGALMSAFTAAVSKRDKDFSDHLKTLEKVKKDAGDQMNKAAAQGMKLAQTDIPAAMEAVSKVIDASDNYAQLTNELQKDMSDSRQELVDTLEKAFNDAGKAIDAAQDQKKKLEDDCNKLDDAVRKTITDMQKQAIKDKKDKLSDVLEGFLKSL